MKPVQYQVNVDFPHVYSPCGESYGLIPVRDQGEAINLIVRHGDWMLIQDNQVAVLSEKDYEAKQTFETFYILR